MFETNYSCPWRGCGATKEITGCRFSLAPMTDRYVEQILAAVARVDTTKVWSTSDKLSTIYRGKQLHVIDAAKAAFVNCYHSDTHMTAEMTFSKGCPGDIDDDSYLASDDVPQNNTQATFPVLCKIAFYPLGIENYMEHIAYVVNLAIEKGLYQESSHYASVLLGSCDALFAYFDAVLGYASTNIKHYVLEASLSVNSPTKE